MSSVKFSLLFTATCLLLFPAIAAGQTKPEQKPEPSGDAQDVIKFDTSLVQTDVMVFDKNGRFVEGLKPEQFQLKINNTQREISFFERVTSGKVITGETEPGEPNSIDARKREAQRRAVIFFVDDLHLAPDSLVRTRKALLDFIDHRIGENDLVAVTSPSGQIGFLQQLTASKDALRSAVARLNYRANPKLDMDKPPMSEYLAMKIREGDEGAITYFIQEIQKQNCYRTRAGLICSVSPQSARQLVKNRANEIAVESAPATDDTLRLLEGLMRTAAQVPGRKLVFVISDGFYLNDKKTGSLDRIKKVTDAAGRAGVVIYTLDARGIVGDSIDINRPMDDKGLLTMAGIGELAASQDGLNALAKDTGGQAFRNTNQPMHEWVEKVMDETSSYYLLAWKPDNDEQKRGKFKNIEISIPDRPDLKVRVRGSYFKSAALPLLSTKKKKDKDPLKAR
ncbi:MAG TPA: VWA domain-containing protein, partial [Pyrinomonadaceae bacterium]|nr:VWA domain-containing protein [Pyrinomonadaceae bacterium]